MKKLNYLDSVKEEETEYYFWNDNINKSQIVKELRNQKYNCIGLQRIFDKTEDVSKIIKSSVQE